MLKKLLKYDMRAVFKVWWIGALISVASAIFGGVLSQIAGTIPPKTENVILGLIRTFCLFTAVICGLTLALSLVLTVVLTIIRFYRHFFTDEGYLTFTLPVSRRTLLFSKTLNAFIWYSLHIIIFFFSALLFWDLATPKEDIFLDFFSLIDWIFEFFWDELGAWLIVYTVEAILLPIVSLILSITLIHFCTTFASVLLKKARGIAGVGIFYALTSTFSLIGQLTLYIFGFAFISASPELLAGQESASVALLLLITIAVIAAISAILYSVTQLLLDRKLNLA